MADYLEEEQEKKSGALFAEWCECEEPQFLCYPEDGACPCGMWKHHVHCTCGYVYQIG